jgi:integrase/recombinase XerC
VAKDGVEMARTSEEKSAASAKALLAVASKDVAHELDRWLTHLASERHLSPATLEVYARDVGVFLGFLAALLGGKPSLKDLSKLAPADVRA